MDVYPNLRSYKRPKWNDIYDMGGYIDLETNKHRNANGKWVLGFNKAYNPWCVYSEAYMCPLVLMENRLEVPIRAGKRTHPYKNK